MKICRCQVGGSVCRPQYLEQTRGWGRRKHVCWTTTGRGQGVIELVWLGHFVTPCVFEYSYFLDTLRIYCCCCCYLATSVRTASALAPSAIDYRCGANGTVFTAHGRIGSQKLRRENSSLFKRHSPRKLRAIFGFSSNVNNVFNPRRFPITRRLVDWWTYFVADRFVRGKTLSVPYWQRLFVLLYVPECRETYREYHFRPRLRFRPEICKKSPDFARRLVTRILCYIIRATTIKGWGWEWVRLEGEDVCIRMDEFVELSTVVRSKCYHYVYDTYLSTCDPKQTNVK